MSFISLFEINLFTLHPSVSEAVHTITMYLSTTHCIKLPKKKKTSTTCTGLGTLWLYTQMCLSMEPTKAFFKKGKALRHTGEVGRSCSRITQHTALKFEEGSFPLQL